MFTESFEMVDSSKPFTFVLHYQNTLLKSQLPKKTYEMVRSQNSRTSGGSLTRRIMTEKQQMLTEREFEQEMKEFKLRMEDQAIDRLDRHLEANSLCKRGYKVSELSHGKLSVTLIGYCIVER